MTVTYTATNGAVLYMTPPEGTEGGSLTLILAEQQVKQLRDLLSTFYTNEEAGEMEARG